MKAIAIIILLIILTGCSVLQQPVKRTFLSLNEIKNQYGLTNHECNAIKKDARTGKIELIYHAGRDQWMYDATVDFSIYKTK